MTPYTEVQLDALRELANVASGTAATALSQMLARDVNLSVPRALALPLADAVDAAGDPAETVTGVILGMEGDNVALMLLLLPQRQAEVLCQLLGVEAGTEWGDSALCEIGNILSASYLSAISMMTGLSLFPGPPQVHTDMLGSIVSSVLAAQEGEASTVLVMDSELDVENEPCALSFMLLPSSGNADWLLEPLGL